MASAGRGDSMEVAYGRRVDYASEGAVAASLIEQLLRFFYRPSSPSSASSREVGREVAEEVPTDQIDLDQVAEVNAVLVAIGQQFHAHQARKRHHGLARLQDDPVLDRRRRHRTIRRDLLSRPQEMHGPARVGVAVLEEHADAKFLEVVHANRQGGRACPSEVRTLEHDIDIVGGADGGGIFGRDPKGDRSTADDRVNHARILEGSRNSLEAGGHLVEGRDVSLPQAQSGGCGRRQHVGFSSFTTA